MDNSISLSRENALVGSAGGLLSQGVASREGASPFPGKGLGGCAPNRYVPGREGGKEDVSFSSFATSTEGDMKDSRGQFNCVFLLTHPLIIKESVQRHGLQDPLRAMHPECGPAFGRAFPFATGSLQSQVGPDGLF